MVEAVGPGVTASTVDDRVMGPAPGAFAEFALLRYLPGHLRRAQHERRPSRP
ncbi:hypothetical protein [Rhodococcus sp. LB1]|uniref:hypothetical protein n=1 Tax=Rhodococcus sp. LB1 TaxID=1807499 RepID=UPI000B17C7D4|nr:hypothetical protein [Rhodococcus sp. LB1]